MLRGLSRAPHHPLPRLDQQVVDQVLEIRDDRTFGLGRTPGGKRDPLLVFVAMSP